MTSVCYILSYYSPNYVRTRTLISALKKIDNIIVYEARNKTKQIFRYFETLWKLIVIRLLKNPEYYILGFRGYEIFWIIRLITLGKTLIFDHMMSPYDSLIFERKKIKRNTISGKFIYHYEKSILLNSEIILTDTEIHKKYFQRLFNIEPGKILAIPVGADEDLFKPTKKTNTSFPFNVLFYGSFLPLHGMDVIFTTASLLRDYPIHFTLIGGNEAKIKELYKKIKELDIDNITHYRWIEFEDLPEFIARADIGLGGPFGNTGQAQRVITGKTYQFLSMAKPVVIGNIALDHGFEDKKNCILVQQGDEHALANAIVWAFENSTILEKIGMGGYELYRSQFSIEEIANKLKKCFEL